MTQEEALTLARRFIEFLETRERTGRAVCSGCLL